MSRPAPDLPDDARTIHFLVHVPKCAGTTIEWHFQKHLGERFLWAPRWRSPLRDVIGNRYPSLTPQDLGGIDVVSGHSLSANLADKFPGARIREHVLLRDPVDWHISMYNYRIKRAGGRGPDFSTWYGTVRRNPISRFLLNRYFGFGVPGLYRLSSAARLKWLEARLSRFAFVGGLHLTDDLIDGVAAATGVPGRAKAQNTIPEKRLTAVDLAPDILDRLRRDNVLDQALFDRWKDRGWDQTRIPPAPSLPGFDQLTLLASDIRSAVLRERG